MYKYQNKYSATFGLVLGLSLIYALVVWSGFYGFGNDYYAAYYKANLAWGGWNEQLGWILSTMTIGNVHIGVFVVSFFLALATGLLTREHIAYKRKHVFLLLLVLMSIAIHTWPIIMSTSNAMRQGLAMSFVFLSLVMFSRNLGLWMVFFLSMASLSHKSGIIFLGIILAAFVSRRIIVHFPVIHFFIGLACFALVYFSLPFYSFLEEDSRIISGDFRLPLLIISMSYIAMATWKRKFLFRDYSMAVYYFSFIFPVFLIQGFNWQFERLGMMMLIPYIFSFGFFLEKKSNTFYLLSTFIMLLVLTIYTGMYAALRA